MREGGADFIMPPPPPPVLDNPNVRHGVIDRPDPHRIDDKARMLAQIEIDQGRRAAGGRCRSTSEFFFSIIILFSRSI